MTKVSTRPPKRLRTRDLKDDSASGMSAVVPWEQRRLFAQLFDDSGGGSGHGASTARRKTSADASMVEALTEQLAPRVLGASQWPLVAVLYLPRLGRINASVRREQGAWNVELAAEEESTARWLGGVRQRCQEGLAQSLRMPVNLGLASVGSA
ncbi:MAG: type III secretion system HrpP C-terminal domain-containing protein [Pseudomonas sp.]|uniref:type III secretion system HrpP C-terminal domain-containing protein n=1 Tax=Pseudomonas sp. TaxID=306 RepID=UPI003C73BCEA